VQVAIRTDASQAIGTGHVMRCLALAGLLRERGAVVRFLCRDEPGNLCDYVASRGFEVRRLAAATELDWQLDFQQSRLGLGAPGASLDLLVVDHYALDERWERSLRPFARRIFVFDDLADRRHDCDLLLDQNLRDHPESRYAGLVPAGARVFVGPEYALLRPEFNSLAPRTRNQGLRRLFVYLGGGDSRHALLSVVEGLHLLGSVAPITTLVLGAANPDAEEVRAAARAVAQLTVLDTTHEMARLIDEADLGIGTCGIAAWERCLLGLPALLVVTADNQRDDARALHALGAARNLGEAGAVTGGKWAQALEALLRDPETLQSMSQAAAAVMARRQVAMRELEAALVH